MASYLESLASSAPTPGGGSAAALVAAMGAALLAMVARITLADPQRVGVHEAARTVVLNADALRTRLIAGREIDEAAYAEVVRSSSLPRGNDEEKALRTARLQNALTQAAAVPLEAAALCLRGLELTEACAALRNTNLASDVSCACEFFIAALAAQAYNVRINHRFLKDARLIAEQEADLRTTESAAATIVLRLRGDAEGGAGT